MLSAAGGCELTATTRVKLPGRSSRSCYQFSLLVTSLSRHVAVYSSCVRSTMLHASETWPLTKPNQHLQRNDRAMIRQICIVKPQDVVTTRSKELLKWIGIEDLDLILKERRLVWYGRGTLQWCSQDSRSHTGCGKAWAWEVQDDMEAADREGLQRMEALSYQPA